ncbi:glutaredoxin family protein [Ectobacillus antri]|uniref:glutaredoxin family protein n=1 Tax=Ectobacillus antri TaxID=2486280 RepID=UPI000F598A52|nr:glutaredoxin family protein [Ectobacillus antri]
MIIVYTKTQCPECSKVKFGLSAAGVAYETRNIEESDQYKQEHAQYGYSAVPVTVFPSGKVLVGFDHGDFSMELGL